MSNGVKMGRPPKPATERKKRRIAVPVTMAEEKAIKKAAKGGSVAAFMREKALASNG